MVGEVVWLISTLSDAETSVLMFALHGIAMVDSCLFIFRFAMVLLAVLCVGNRWPEFVCELQL